ncbi:hypothetical protein KX928_01225 [Roseobacter sp. YSTF-M11]|uniref:Uncharacterized protein n=1 Tax=Roseobacter insulae TaxID=2859783 RepID=A0A9X1FRS5_9RHOB|nr:hypothetical protein [Roseobacter insulae]MBW4706402.1 hypothetical protein [Roseobacter insulae]
MSPRHGAAPDGLPERGEPERNPPGPAMAAATPFSAAGQARLCIAIQNGVASAILR